MLPSTVLFGDTAKVSMSRCQSSVGIRRRTRYLCQAIYHNIYFMFIFLIYRKACKRLITFKIV